MDTAFGIGIWHLAFGIWHLAFGIGFWLLASALALALALALAVAVAVALALALAYPLSIQNGIRFALGIRGIGCHHTVDRIGCKRNGKRIGGRDSQLWHCHVASAKSMELQGGQAKPSKQLVHRWNFAFGVRCGR